MAYLTKANKPDLLAICEKIGVEVDPSTKVVDIKKLIIKRPLYNEEEVKMILDRIFTNRKEQRELEMKKLEVAQSSQRIDDESRDRAELGPKIQLAQILPKFDEKHDEMGLYLINFERRAEMAQVPKKHWIAYLLAVLPAELSNMLVREPASEADNYNFVKSIILKRYKLNSEKLKQCFYRHQKSAEKSWRNYAHELNSYFTEWISDLEVKTFGTTEGSDDYRAAEVPCSCGSERAFSP
ncbi:hypothetical protein AVEN_103999-1 [Araneus ventricosus]|uniref:Uncharacterized protein n=1 Tax=Araneus ventricosus TaxID=182803 RepID=A0A4Y2TX65_ARAVE|nr:hypothetical protein AVEN_103999-1 [Araneus ventricosus]